MKYRNLRNMRRRNWARAIRELPPEEKFAYEQFLLYHKLHRIFYKKEYVSYENLPEKLRDQLEPFEEFLFP